MQRMRETMKEQSKYAERACIYCGYRQQGLHPERFKCVMCGQENREAQIPKRIANPPGGSSPGGI